jgi:hypothetical protein
MTSQINPNDINGAYPVAGQDNSSQGFRNNFTNIKTNFQYAAAEITGLQNNSILAANLSNSAPVVNNLQTSTISNGFLTNMYATQVNLGTITSATANFAAGSYQTFTTNGNTSIAFSNFPATGAVATLNIEVNVANAQHAVTFTTLSANGWFNANGIPGCSVSNTTATIQFASTGIYNFSFTTDDSGGNITVNQTNEQLKPFNNTTEVISSDANCNLALSTTIFSVTGNVTANLAAGVSGQIRTLVAANISAGNAIVVTTDAGWKSSGPGNIVLAANGSGVTMQYVNSKWYAIGNNGATFL